MSNYSDKLKDPKWQKKRLKIMERDQWKCRLCDSSTKTLNVHHWWYEAGKEPWDQCDRSFATICEDCHEEETTLRPYNEEALLQMLKAECFSARDVAIVADLAAKGLIKPLVEEEKKRRHGKAIR